jgi:hypothetical protein
VNEAMHSVKMKFVEPRLLKTSRPPIASEKRVVRVVRAAAASSCGMLRQRMSERMM